MANGQALIDVAPGTVRSALAWLQERYPGLRERILDNTGQVHRYVNVYVNEEDIRFLNHLETLLGDGDELSILPAIAGG